MAKDLYSIYARAFSSCKGRDLKILPPSVEIDLTNSCNQNCLYCNVCEYREKFPSKANKEDYIKLIDMLKEWNGYGTFRGNVNTITFVGGGEPTLFKNYEQIIEKAIDDGFLVSIITNGTHLDKLFNMSPEKLEKISWIGVDFDAGEEPLYNQIRRPSTKDDFRRVTDNVKRLTAAGVRVDMKVLLFDANSGRDAIRRMFELAREMKVRMIYFRLANINSDIYNVDENIIAYIDELSNELSVKSKVNVTRRLQRTYKKCYSLFLLPVFSADGSVYLCCEYRGNKSFILCNWLKEDFREFWCGDRHMELFEKLDVNKCKPCRANIHNISIKKLIDEPEDLEQLFF